jgi:cytochrome c
MRRHFACSELGYNSDTAYMVAFSVPFAPRDAYGVVEIRKSGNSRRGNCAMLIPTALRSGLEPVRKLPLLLAECAHLWRIASIHSAAILIGALLSWLADSAAAQSPTPHHGLSDPAVTQSPGARRGLRFVRLHCARCHAIDKESESPLAIAPPFRTLHLRYSVADLQRPLAHGIHPKMPLFRLEPSQVEDVMTYLKTLER